ncbi:glycosyltransferase family 4 protein [uncultured Psychroserpens sp.]|uniref:glycosyltransferase family 4 protein n=1 Tax=uncultured Psychroserpens sp. TaxID=255436 RepID=UPI002623AA17|nr:glycosyltransferase family 4 protein [uncultured Psychroserpens sp.]
MLLNKFNQVSRCSDVFQFVRHDGYIKTLFIKKLKRLLNESSQLISVFGCNTEFYYQFLPHVNTKIKRIDLTHAFSAPDYGLEQFSIPFVGNLDYRVVINTKTKKDFEQQYLEHTISKERLDHIICIPNGIDIETNSIHRNETSDLTVGFFGRWSKEKRPQLFLEVAKHLGDQNRTVNFKMAGTALEPHKAHIENSNVEYLGELSEKSAISDFYKSIDILVITSYREGFPLVIMEAMSYGVIVMATNVGSISEHIKTNENGMLITETDPDQIVRTIAEKIVVLSNDSELKKELHSNALDYAKSNFGIRQFNKVYRTLLTNE